MSEGGIEVVERPRRKKSKTPAKGKKRAAKKPSLSKLKKELDRCFSLYIRAKYPKECYTCGGKGTLQCGHFVSRMYLATRWDENNARPQCVGCNIWGSGKPLDFEERLILEIGADAVSSLKRKRKEVLKLSRGWYEAEIARFQALLEGLGIK